MGKILVTGAAGFIGSHTVDRLLAEGHSVVGVDDFRTGHRANLAAALKSPAFTFHEADVAGNGALASLVGVEKPDAIIHLAALVSVQESMTNPALNFSLNIHATYLVAEAARLHRINRVVFASSAAVYGDNPHQPLAENAEKRPLSPYGAAKLASEGILCGHAAAFGFTIRCQRYFNVYGTRQDPSSPYSGVISIFAKRYHEGRGVTIYGDGLQTRDFISVSDVARANVIAATRPGLLSGTANICTGRATSLLGLAAIFGRHLPGSPAPDHAPARAGDILRSLGDPSRAKEEMGFSAQTTVDAGLAEMISRSAEMAAT